MFSDGIFGIEEKKLLGNNYVYYIIIIYSNTGIKHNMYIPNMRNNWIRFMLYILEFIFYIDTLIILWFK